MSSLSTLTVKLTAQVAEFTKGIDAAANDLRSFQTKASAAFGQVKTAFVALGAAVAAQKLFGALTGVAGDLAGIADVAGRLGITTDALQELNYTAEMNASSAEEMTKSLDYLSLKMGEVRQGSASAAESFTRLGLDAQQIAAMSPDQALAAISDRFQQLPADVDKAAIAAELFGVKNKGMIEVLNLGSAELQKWAGEAQAVGAVVSGETIEQFASLDDSLVKTGLQFKAFLAEALQPLIPVIQGVIEWGTNLVTWLNDTWSSLDGSTQTAVKFVAAFAAFLPIGLKVVSLFAAVIKAIRAFNVAKQLSLALSGPKGWAILAGAGIALGATMSLFSQSDAAMKDASKGAEQATRNVKAVGTAAEEAAKKYEGLRKEAEKIIAAERSPAQVLADKAKEIEAALKAGGIKSEQAAALLNKAEQEFFKNDPAHQTRTKWIDDMKKKAESLAESLKTPFEKLQEQVTEVGVLFENGFIGTDTFQAQVDKLRGEMAKLMLDAESVANPLKGVAAVDAEFPGFSAVQAAQRQAASKDEQGKQQTRLLTEANEVLRKILEQSRANSKPIKVASIN